MGSEYQPLSSAESCRSLFIETSECFICRDGELKPSNLLRNFCDCKNLLAHHMCLSAWIQRGCGSEDRLRCIICKAKYQLQRSSPWQLLCFQWQTWLVLITAVVLLGLVPYVVHCMMTAFTNPPPPITFKVAAVSFGVLTELLLIKCVSSYLSGRYRQAEQHAFTVQPRGNLDRLDPSEEASAAEGQAPSPASPSRGEEKKVDALKSGHLCFL
ncbi:uncharacterized protein LOC121652696 [Melanotaenia boesemani]|uniref:uncharacterized protein LOC121652696 n=1 Tax=Melanotaenia boesemani TaxID=1250792 RepID=UPI001C054597|nr:uncharacterized protein LOC121652696 [Melanotaenia boesemani]XP_041861552.1 uncharacterized protein LOC121652696 [Melanotaenia boesemani]